MSDAPSPPRLAERFVALAARRPQWRDDLLGDLREEYAARARARPLVARLWYWGQALGLLVSAAWASITDRTAQLRVLLFVGENPMSAIRQEVTLAFRGLGRQPLVTSVILLTLALGLGVNSAAFSIIDALMLRPFAYSLPDPQHVGLISEESMDMPYPRESVSPANYLDWKQQATSFDRMAAFDSWSLNIAAGDVPQHILGYRVTGEFFDVLGIKPAAGRFIAATDERPGSPRVLILSDAFWKQQFGGRPVVGQMVRVDGEPYDIIGIAPPGFDFPTEADVWSALSFSAADAAKRTDRHLTVIGRLKPGTSFTSAKAEMSTIGARLTAQYPDDNTGYDVKLQTLTQGMRDVGLPPVMSLVQVGALFVLVIAGLNIANLLFARTSERRRDVAVRLAIGASRVHVIRQLLVETALVGLISVPVALAFAWLGVHAMAAAMPARIVRFVAGWTDMGVNPRLVAGTTVLAVGASLLISLIPALKATSPDVVDELRDGGRSATAGRSRHRLRRMLVVAQIALTLPLLVAAGIATLGVRQFVNGPQGYDPGGLLVLRLGLPEVRYADDVARRRFTEQLLDRAAHLPGVAQAATTNAVPSGNHDTELTIDLEGAVAPKPADRPMIAFRVVSPDYFTVMRIPTLSGRTFSVDDRPDGLRTTVVSESFAKRFWPGANPIGKRVRAYEDQTAEGTWLTVVGTVGNTIEDWFAQRNAPTLYLPMAQRPSFGVDLVLRAADPLSVAHDAERAIADIDSQLAPTAVMPMSQVLLEHTFGLRAIGTMVGVLGALALVLSTVGVYSVMAYYVAQRRYELGIRMALGATGRDVLRLTVGQGWRLAGVGIAIGLVLAVFLARAMETALIGIAAAGPPLLAAVAGILGAIAFVACLIPARAAAKIDPAKTLRSA